MFRRKYYYLVAGLPDIVLDQKKLAVSVADFRAEIEYQLHSDDYLLVRLLFLPFDNTNLLNLLLKNKKSFIDIGNFSQHKLEEEIMEPSKLPGYMKQFIIAFKNENPVFQNYSWENQLTWLYYDHVLMVKNTFLKEWFTFNLHAKNIFSAFNIRNYKLPKDNVYIGDNYVTEALKRSSLKDFGLSNDLPFVEKLLSIDENTNAMEKEKAFDIIRWNFLNELNTFNYFTIEVIIAFIIKLFMVDRWLKLDPETGRKMLKQIITDLDKSYEFPKEFKVNEGRKQ